jgi:hypothetical protein
MRRAIVLLAAGAWFCNPAAAQVIDRIDTIGAYLDACVVKGLQGQGFRPRREATLRLAFRRDGAVIGKPVVTFSRPGRDDPEQRRFLASLSEAYVNCTPLPFSKELGAAIAGKIFTFRYTLTDTKDLSI